MINKANAEIAVVGAGVAGLTAAYLLQRRHRVTLFEKNDYPGGHTHTIVLPDGPDSGTPVDTGFIVMNHRNYPLLTRLFEQLGVALRDSDMSFGYWDRQTGLQYAGSDLNTMFAQRRNIVSPRFLGMVRDVLRFYRRANRDLREDAVPATLTLGDYLRQGGYAQTFVRHHIVPMGAAIWSTPAQRMMEFPARNFLHFFRNHGLLSLDDRPQWKTVEGGSHVYVRRMLEQAKIALHLSAPIAGVRRLEQGVELVPEQGEPRQFDAAVLACHADQALAMLTDPSGPESRLLGAWQYAPNHTALHTDATVMPSLRRVWSSWNYVRDAGAADAAATLSYHMNRLQRLRAERDYFVTLNRCAAFPAGSVVAEMNYEHPTYSREALAAQQELPALNGVRRTWFCGSYFGYGFHEDAVRAGVQVARAFQLDL